MLFLHFRDTTLVISMADRNSGILALLLLNHRVFCYQAGTAVSPLPNKSTATHKILQVDSATTVILNRE